MIDVTHQINAVQRRVGTRTLEAGEARTVVISQTYDAAVEDVWDACTSAERIPRWFLPVSGDLKPGGRYQLEGNAGGTIERCDPPESFFVTWEYGGQVSWVEVRLTAAAPDRTQLEIEHIAHVSDEMWAQFGPGRGRHRLGLHLLGLSLHLSGAPGHGSGPGRGLGRVRRGQALHDAQRRALVRGPHRGRRRRDRGPRDGRAGHRRLHHGPPS